VKVTRNAIINQNIKMFFTVFTCCLLSLNYLFDLTMPAFIFSKLKDLQEECQPYLQVLRGILGSLKKYAKNSKRILIMEKNYFVNIVFINIPQFLGVS
jgi:hypothetical protein